MTVPVMTSAASMLQGAKGASKSSLPVQGSDNDVDTDAPSGAEAFAGYLAALQQPQAQQPDAQPGGQGQSGSADDATVTAASALTAKASTTALASVDLGQSPLARLLASATAATDAPGNTTDPAATADAAGATEAANSANAEKPADAANAKLFDALGMTVPELVEQTDPGELGKLVSAAARAHAAEVHETNGHAKADWSTTQPTAEGSTDGSASPTATSTTGSTAASMLADLLDKADATVTSLESSDDDKGARMLASIDKAEQTAARTHASATGATATQRAANGAHKSADGTVTLAPIGVAASPQAAASSSVAAPDVVTADPSLGLHEQISEPVVALRARGNGTHNLIIEVHPQDLGAVQVQVRVDGTNTSVTLTGGNQAHEALRAALPALHAELRAAGLHDVALNLNTSTDGSQSGAHQNQGLHNGFGAGQGGSGNAAAHEARGQQPDAHPDNGSTPTRNDVTRPTRPGNANGVDRLL